MPEWQEPAFRYHRSIHQGHANLFVSDHQQQARVYANAGKLILQSAHLDELRADRPFADGRPAPVPAIRWPLGHVL